MDPQETALLDGLARLGPALLAGLSAVEHAQRRLHPPEFDTIRRQLVPVGERLQGARREWHAVPAPEALAPLARQVGVALDATANALEALCRAGEPGEAIGRVLGAFRTHCRAQEALYPLRRAVPPFGRYFLEPAAHARDPALFDPETPHPVGLHNASNGPGQRGGFALYVPEWYDDTRVWPLVVALHGGMGHGADFLWSWLREARTRGFLLLAPTSRGSTWSLDAPHLDGRAIESMVDFVAERWRVDPEARLLTGLSDGATFALLHGLSEGSRFGALAPVSGVLHPLNHAMGNVERARDRRIFLVHGRLDWMFPAALAETAARALGAAGGEVELEIVEDLSHTYPREMNGRLLAWLDPRLGVGSG